MRRFFALTLVLVLTFGMGTSAVAQWLATGTGSGAAASGVLHAPASVDATATGTATVRISWSAPSAPSATPATYTVRRDGAVVCSGVAAPPCEDSGLAPGTTYGYTVQSVLQAWTSAEFAVTDATTDAAATPQLSFSPECPSVVPRGETRTITVVSSAPTSVDVTVTITHDGNRGSIDKRTVTIPAGQTASDSFTYSRQDHSGNNPSTVTATATGYNPTPPCSIQAE